MKVYKWNEIIVSKILRLRLLGGGERIRASFVFKYFYIEYWEKGQVKKLLVIRI